jgi:hypothetical protein
MAVLISFSPSILNNPAVTTSIAFFEVMDKEPSLLYLAGLYGLLGATGYGLSRIKWWLALLPLLLVAFFAWGDISELRDPYVGPAILQEAGYRYVAARCGVILGGFLLPLIGTLQKRASSLRVPSR